MGMLATAGVIDYNIPRKIRELQLNSPIEANSLYYNIPRKIRELQLY